MSDTLREWGYDEERESRFAKMLKRRNELREIIKEKYPEVYELLQTYYAEKDWR